MKRGAQRTGRAALVALTIGAWFAMTNHCALALGPCEPEAPSAECPMHVASGHPAPAKQKGSASDVPCCKSLRALAAKPGTSVAKLVALFAQPVVYAVTTVLFAPSPALCLGFARDTGPPPAPSFAELILQRSMLVHAPPAGV